MAHFRNGRRFSSLGSACILAALTAGLLLWAGCHPSQKLDVEDLLHGGEMTLWPGDGDDPDTQREFCDTLAGEAVPGGSFVFALTDSVVPSRAPVPHNPSERIVFAQLYETLVNMDCAGRLLPGLADQWTCTQDSTVWVFSLRSDARFWDGSRVNAGDVKQSWSSNQSCPIQKSTITPWAWFNAQASTITVLDARRVSIRLPEPQADFPALLTHPATAIAVPREGWTWPVGSGPARLRASTPPPLPDLQCRPNPQHPQAPIWKQLTFLVRPGLDSRDLAATSFQLAQVTDLEVVRFYRELPEFTLSPLPWNRLYLLVCSAQANPSGSMRWLQPAKQLRPSREMTRATARRWPEIVLPAGTGPSCPQLAGPVETGGSARRDWNLEDVLPDPNALVYDALDPGAQELARRLVAFGDSEMKATGVPGNALGFTLQWEMGGAFVIPMDLDFPTSCLQLASLLGRASWLQKAALTGLRLPDGPLDPESLASVEQAIERSGLDPRENLVELGLVHPLALTHPWLLARGELAGLRLAFDGTPWLSGLGRPVAKEILP